MLAKFYRVGAAYQAIEKSYLLGGVAGDGLKQYWRPVNPGFSLAMEPRHPAQVRLVSAPTWLGDFSARQAFFQALAAEQMQLERAAHSAGGQLLPGAFDLLGDGNPASLVGDLHRVIAADEVEQGLYCQVLREQLPVLISVLGRGLVSASGVEPVQSTRLLNGALFAAKQWPVTSARHIARVEGHYRKSQGMTSLSSLDVFPGHAAPGKPQVTVAALDAQVWLDTVRGSSILLQALFLKARRMAREGHGIDCSRQRRFEMNRSKAAAEGPFALLDPAGRPAGRAWLELVLDLRREFRVLEVRYPEFEGLVLGPILRVMGRGAAQCENDALRTLLASHGKTGKPLSELARDCLSRPMDNPLREMNRKRYGSTAAELEHWWTRWLSGEPNLPDLLPTARPKLPRQIDKAPPEASKARPERENRERPKPPNRDGGERAQFARFVERWKALALDSPPTVRLGLLAEFESLAKPMGRLIGSLPDLDKRGLRSSLRKLANKEFHVSAGKSVAEAPVLRQACQQAVRQGVSLLHVEAKEGASDDLDQSTAQAVGALPQELFPVFFFRMVKGPVCREELLLVRRGAGHGE